jgi:spore maturation protein CgeB
MGLLYPKRIEFIKRLESEVTYIHSVSDPDPRASFSQLNSRYNSIEVFMNFPALSRLLVTKVYEVMASKCLLLQPQLDDPAAAKNMSLFIDKTHIVYYDYNNPKNISDLCHYFSVNQAERNEIVESGYKEIVTKHDLNIRVKKILADAEKLISGR